MKIKETLSLARDKETKKVVNIIKIEPVVKPNKKQLEKLLEKINMEKIFEEEEDDKESILDKYYFSPDVVKVLKGNKSLFPIRVYKKEDLDLDFDFYIRDLELANIARLYRETFFFKNTDDNKNYFISENGIFEYKLDNNTNLFYLLNVNSLTFIFKKLRPIQVTSVVLDIKI